MHWYPEEWTEEELDDWVHFKGQGPRVHQLRSNYGLEMEWTMLVGIDFREWWSMTRARPMPEEYEYWLENKEAPTRPFTVE